MRKCYDITLTISPDILTYPGDPHVVIAEGKSILAGDKYNLSIITLGTHTGTHIDAPKHFYDRGLTIDKLPLDHFVGKAKVFEIKQDCISAKDLEKLEINKGDIILLKTKNSYNLGKKDFAADFSYIETDAAEYLANIGIRTLGFDYLSIEKYGSEVAEAHYALLRENIAIIEGLDLRDVFPGKYYLIAPPLKIKDGNGAPVRALLLKDDDS